MISLTDRFQRGKHYQVCIKHVLACAIEIVEQEASLEVLLVHQLNFALSFVKYDLFKRDQRVKPLTQHLGMGSCVSVDVLIPENVRNKHDFFL